MLADQAVRCGDASKIVAGGMENMTAAPHLVPAMRSGTKLGDAKMIDAMIHTGSLVRLNPAIWECTLNTLPGNSMCREKIKIGLRAQSQQRAAQAQADNVFADEICPVTVKHRKGDVVVEADEGPRADTTADGLAKLRTVFDKQGTVTAGNASTLSDGAAAVVVVDESTAANHDSKFKILASFTSGTEPQDLFIAPVAAIEGALAKAGLSKDEIDLYEINEAFASQMVACIKELEIDESKNQHFWRRHFIGTPHWSKRDTRSRHADERFKKDRRKTGRRQLVSWGRECCCHGHRVGLTVRFRLLADQLPPRFISS